MQTNTNFKTQFDSLVESSNKILIVSHMSPDPDAIFSVLGLKEYFAQVFPNKNVTIAFSNSKIVWHHFNKELDQIVWTQNIISLLHEEDLIIFVDGNSKSRFTPTPEDLDLKKYKTICIDHHKQEHDHYDLELIEPEASATCKMITDYLFISDDLLTKQACEYLIRGLISDMGFFRYVRKNNSDVFLTAKRLIDVGNLDMEYIYHEVNVMSDNAFKIFQLFVAHTVNVKINDAIPNLTYAYLPKHTLKEFRDMNVLSADIFQTLVLRQIKNHPWGFTVIPKPNKKFRISFRSTVGAVNVRLICEKYFNGGGHDLAAAGTYILSEEEKDFDSEDVCKKVIELIKGGSVEIVK